MVKITFISKDNRTYLESMEGRILGQELGSGQVKISRFIEGIFKHGQTRDLNLTDNLEGEILSGAGGNLFGLVQPTIIPTGTSVAMYDLASISSEHPAVFDTRLVDVKYHSAYQQPTTSEQANSPVGNKGRSNV